MMHRLVLQLAICFVHPEPVMMIANRQHGFAQTCVLQKPVLHAHRRK